MRRVGPVVAVAVVVALFAPPANAASLACGSETIVWIEGEETLTLARESADGEDYIRVDTSSGTLGGRCAIDGIETVSVMVGDAMGLPPEDHDAQTVVLDLSGGSFGAIDFSMNLGHSDDTLEIGGSGRADQIHIGVGGVSLDGDGRDVVMAGVERVSVRGRGGRDLLTAQGGAGTDGPAGIPVTLRGGGGGDELRGGMAAGDELSGGGGGDRLYARDGLADTVLGGGGRDTAEVDPQDTVSSAVVASA